MSVPSFVKHGAAGLDNLNAGKFVKLTTGTPVEFVCLTGIEPPEGEEPSGTNSVISFNEYTMWLDDLPEGKLSPRFPAIGGAGDPGQMLGLQPRFRMMMLVMPKGEEEEKILSATVSVFKQLVDVEQAIGESLRGHVLRLTKSGEGLKTKYRVVPTGRKVDIDGAPALNLVDYIGPSTREEIVTMLTEAGQWPPEGGDPYAPKAKLAGKAPKTTSKFDDMETGEADA